MDADRIMTRLNPLIVAILRSPLHFIASAGLMLLTVTGRKSGRRYTIPVGYQKRDDSITVLVSKARRKNWWRNYREPGPVELRLRGQDLRGTARLVRPDQPAFRQAAEATFRRVPGLHRQFGLDDFDRTSGLSDVQWQIVAREGAMVEITLTP